MWWGLVQLFVRIYTPGPPFEEIRLRTLPELTWSLTVLYPAKEYMFFDDLSFMQWN